MVNLISFDFSLTLVGALDFCGLQIQLPLGRKKIPKKAPRFSGTEPLNRACRIWLQSFRRFSSDPKSIPLAMRCIGFFPWLQVLYPANTHRKHQASQAKRYREKGKREKGIKNAILNYTPDSEGLISNDRKHQFLLLPVYTSVGRVR